MKVHIGIRTVVSQIYNLLLFSNIQRAWSSSGPFSILSEVAICLRSNRPSVFFFLA